MQYCMCTVPMSVMYLSRFRPVYFLNGSPRNDCCLFISVKSLAASITITSSCRYQNILRMCSALGCAGIAHAATTGKRSDFIHFSGIQVGNLTSNPGTETLPATSCPCWFLHSSHGDRLVFFILFSISPSYLFRHSPCERHWSLLIAHRAVCLLPSGVYLSICEGVVAQEVVFCPNAIWKTLILACAEYFTMMGKTS